MLSARKKPYRGLPMEGFIATWYTKNTGKDLGEFRACADKVAAQLAPGARILEVAPGPGFLAIELAKLGYEVTGLDISHSFVRIANENAARAGVSAEFRHGNASQLPFDDGSFDFVVCRAAFKNFTAPVAALREMRRVLVPGGEALVIDMRRDVSNAEIDDAVRDMKLGAVDALLTKGFFRYMGRKTAYTRDGFRAMARTAAFAQCDVRDARIGVEVWLRK